MIRATCIALGLLATPAAAGCLTCNQAPGAPPPRDPVVLLPQSKQIYDRILGEETLEPERSLVSSDKSDILSESDTSDFLSRPILLFPVKAEAVPFIDGDHLSIVRRQMAYQYWAKRDREALARLKRMRHDLDRSRLGRPSIESDKKSDLPSRPVE